MMKAVLPQNWTKPASTSCSWIAYHPERGCNRAQTARWGMPNRSLQFPQPTAWWQATSFVCLARTTA